MSVINIDGQVIVIKNHDGQRVVTFKDIDKLHGRKEGTAARNFRQNQSRLVEGEDYFRRNSSEAFAEWGIKAPNGLTLLAESGYLMLVKSLQDDLAWNVQRQLVKTYFKVKETPVQQSDTTSLSPLLQVLIGIETRQNAYEAKQIELQAENEELRKDMKHLSLVVDNEVWITEHQKSDIRDAVKSRVGKLKSQTIDAHFQGCYGDLNTFFSVGKYDKIARKDFDQAIDFIQGWFPKKKENLS
jgi:hypothetical protein